MAVNVVSALKIELLGKKKYKIHTLYLKLVYPSNLNCIKNIQLEKSKVELSVLVSMHINVMLVSA
jgi:hypothetical protein